VDAVVDAATGLADAERLDSLTMRRLAERLEVGPMSLYTYVPGRAELLDLMLDTAYGRMPRSWPHASSWQQRVRKLADDNRALFQRHPWAAEVSTLRPPLGPGQMAKYEHELAAFQGSGLSDLQTDDALNHLLTFVRANARDAAAAVRAQREHGTDQQWWDAAGPLLAQVLDENSYPLATRIGTAAGTTHRSAHDPDHAYRFGVDRIIEALHALTLTNPAVDE
jgi:AcrR family transcriptional regulator